MNFDEENIRRIIDEYILFNQHLGLHLVALDREGTTIVRVPFREEFMGDPVKRIIHGGVLAALIDVTGGATTFASVMQNPQGVAGMNTIDMRVDYLRPGTGDWFEGHGRVIRKGNRIVVTHVHVYSSTGEQVAMGTASFSIQQKRVTPGSS